MLDCLDDRERDTLRLRFGLDRGQPRTLDEVGEVFHLTRGADPSDRGPGHVEASAPHHPTKCPGAPHRMTPTTR